MSEEKKENFCSACALVPLAMSGVGTSIYGSTPSSKDNSMTYRQRKRIMFWIGCIITVISLALIMYFSSSCSECR